MALPQVTSTISSFAPSESASALPSEMPKPLHCWVPGSLKNHGSACAAPILSEPEAVKALDAFLAG